jgi:hypothetical protein
MKYPEKGDKLWFVHDGYPIIIRVTVMEIHHGEVEIDEPVEFDIEYTDLCWTVEHAEDRLFACMEESKQLWCEEFPGHYGLEFSENYTLEKYRKEVSSTLRCQEEENGNAYSPKKWPDKEDDEWFAIREIRERRGTTKSAFEELYGDV